MYCGRENRKDKCKLIEIVKNNLAISEEVVRWCSYCGAIVVDEDYDGRTNAGQIRPIQFPKLSKEIIDK